MTYGKKDFRIKNLFNCRFWKDRVVLERHVLWRIPFVQYLPILLFQMYICDMKEKTFGGYKLSLKMAEKLNK